MIVLPKLARADVPLINAVARWAGITGTLGRRTNALAGGPVRVRGIGGALGDPHAARCELRIGGVSVEILGASMGVRRIVQHVLGGPVELAAPRPLGPVEHAVWALVVAAALEDLEIAGEVWPCEHDRAGDTRELAIELELAGAPFTIAIRAPRSFMFHAPPTTVPGWAERVHVDAEIVVGRCVIETATLAGLAARNIVTIERVGGDAELCVQGGVLGLAIRSGSMVAEVATGYVPRAMSLPDDAHVELTVGLGTTQLSLRQVFELAVGQVVPLGRPLAGPFEIRAQGTLVGRGELVDVDGELGVRVVSLGDQEKK